MTFDVGYSRLLITRVEGNDTYSGIVIGDGLDMGGIKLIKNQPKRYFSKEGDFRLVEEHNLRLVPIQIAVLGEHTMVNITKLNEGDSKFLNSESESDTQRYLQQATSNGVVAATPLAKKAKMPITVEALIHSPVYFNGFQYQGIVGAFNALRDRYSDSVVLDNGITELDDFVRDLLYTSLLQNPGLQDKSWDFKTMVHDLKSTPEYFQTTETTNNFVTALEDAMLAIEALNITPRKASLLQENLSDIAAGKINSVTVDIGTTVPTPVGIGDVLFLRDANKNGVRVVVDSIERMPLTETVDKLILGYSVLDLREGKMHPFEFARNEIHKAITKVKGKDFSEMDRDMMVEDIQSIINALSLGGDSRVALYNAASLIGNSASLDAAQATIEEIILDIPNASEVLEVFQELFLALNSGLPKDTKVPVKDSTVSQYNPDSDVVLYIESASDYEHVMDELKNAIASGVKKITTLTEEDLEANEAAQATRKAIEYVKNQGYTERIIDGFRELHRPVTEELKISPKSIVATSEGISTEIKEGTKKLNILDVSEESNVICEVTPHALKVNFSKMDASALYKFITANPTVTFRIDTVNNRIIENLRRMKTESLGYPKNLSLSKALKSKLVKQEKVESVGAQVKGTVKIKNTTINLSDIGIKFDLSDDQVRVLNEYASWLNSNTRKPFSIEGPAGTGKTTLLRVAKHYADKTNRSTKFTAMTNMAAINLEMLIASHSSTVHSLLGISPQVGDIEGLSFDEDDADVSKIEPGTVIFIDEAFFASNSLTTVIMDKMSAKGIKVVFIGSEAQLPSIDAENYIVFNPDIVELHRLTQIKRQSTTNPALLLYSRLAINQDSGYNFEPFVHHNYFYNHDKTEGVYMLYRSQEDKFIAEAIKQFQKDINAGNVKGTRVLCFSNKQADKYNTIIRKGLGFTSGPIMKDEIVFLSEPTADPEGRKGLPYKVTNVEVDSKLLHEDSTVKVSIHRVTLEVDENTNYTIDGVKALKPVTVEVVANTPENRIGANEYAAYVQELRNKAYATYDKAYKRKLTMEYVAALNAYSFMMDLTGKVQTKNGEKTVVVIKQGLNYGYASTIHKAQGSTFDRTFIDENNIRFNITYHEEKNFKKLPKKEYYKQYNRALYVALTRARNLSVVLTGTSYNSYYEGEGVKGDIKNKLDEDLAGIMDDSTIENRRLTLDTGVTVTENSPEHVVHELYDAMGMDSQDKVLSIAGISNKTVVETALFNAVPNHIIIYDESNPYLVAALDTLMDDVAIESSDPRVREITKSDDLHLYNKYVYDKYVNEVYRALIRELPADYVEDNKANVLEARGLNVKEVLNSDIKTLTQVASTLKVFHKTESPESIKDKKTRLQKIEAQILDKENQKRGIDERISIDDLSKIARYDLDQAKKILTAGDITQDEYNRIKKALELWMKVGDFSDPSNNLFLDEVESMEGDNGFRSTFILFANEAMNLYSLLDEKGLDIVINDVSANTGKVVTKENIFKLRNTLSWFTRAFYSVAEIDNPIIAHVTKLINLANKKAEITALEESKNLADAYKKMEQDHGGKAPDNLFWQTTTIEGKEVPTGKLTHKFTYAYDKLKASIKRPGNSKNFIRFKAATIVIDPRRILKEADRVAYIKELSKYFNPGEAEVLVQEALDKWAEYSDQRNNYYQTVYGKPYSDKKADWTEEEQDAIRKWHSETYPINRVIEYQTFNDYTKFTTGEATEKYLVIVPKRKIYSSRDTMSMSEYYDSKYDTIQSKSSTREFYSYAEAITKRSKDNFNDNYMSDYALGAVSREVVDEWRDNSIGKVTLRAAWDKIVIKGLTSKDEFELDPEAKKTLKKGVTTLESAIQDEYSRLKKLRYSEDVELPYSISQKLYAEASDNVMKLDKADIFMALNNLNMAALSYSYKTAIQPSIELALHYAGSMQRGEARGTKANLVTQEDIDTAMEMTEYFVNKEFYSLGAPDKSYRLPMRKLYTSEEKIKKEKLEYEIQKIEAIPEKKRTVKENTLLAQHNEALKQLGGDMTMGSIVKGLIGYTRWLSIGWGFQAGLINTLQGQIANIVMSNAGTHYDFEELRQAYGMLMMPGADRDKFGKLVSTYALLGDVMYDFNKSNTFTKNRSKVRRAADIVLDPFLMTKVTERGNQGVIMIATMLHSKVTDKTTGETKSMWEALDADGNLADNYEYKGKSGVEAVARQVIETTELITSIHGDYVNPKMAQEKVLGRAFLMFKMWFFDPLMVRFGKTKYNHILDKETKGRYITIAEHLNPFKLYQDYKNGKLSAVDMENARTALAEGMSILTVLLAQLMAKWALCNKDECKKKQYVINTFKRLNGEVMTYVTPGGYLGFINNPLAVANTLKVMRALGGDMMGLLTTPESSTAVPGYNLMVHTGKAIPGVRRFMVEYNLATEDIPDYNQ